MVRLDLLLADDDVDDCIFFKEALQELPLPTSLTTVHDGVQLMDFLRPESASLPHVLFLDLNMPLKNGHECLLEIKSHPVLKRLPVIIYSTSYESGVVRSLFELGATHYIRKPASFTDLKSVILKSLLLISEVQNQQPMLENFIIPYEKSI